MNAAARRARSAHAPHSRGENVPVVDICAGVSSRLIAKAITQLWSVVGGCLDPVVDDAGCATVCPITLDTLMDPVMLSDGGIYEMASIAKWLQTHKCAPCTNAPLRHKGLLKLESLRMVIQDVLHAEGSNSDEKLLQKAAREAEMAQVPSQGCHLTLQNLQAALAAATLKIIVLQETVSRAEQAALELQKRISTWAATCIKAHARTFAARSHLVLVRKERGREAVAAALIQKSWLEYRKKKALREKRRRKRMKKHAKAKKQCPGGTLDVAEKPVEQFPGSAPSWSHCEVADPSSMYELSCQVRPRAKHVAVEVRTLPNTLAWISNDVVSIGAGGLIASGCGPVIGTPVWTSGKHSVRFVLGSGSLVRTWVGVADASASFHVAKGGAAWGFVNHGSGYGAAWTTDDSSSTFGSATKKLGPRGRTIDMIVDMNAHQLFFAVDGWQAVDSGFCLPASVRLCAKLGGEVTVALVDMSTPEMAERQPWWTQGRS